MTGIERLRVLSAGWDEMGLGGVLADVADQIERELSEERRRRSRDWREVSQVQREMRQRLFGHDSAGDDLLSRWAERLLAAVCSQAAVDDAPVGAYDLLPEDERGAIAWVREHGGLEEVKARWTGHIPLSNVKRMVELHKAKRERLKAHSLWLERTCRERQNHIVELNKMVAEMRPRLMPEGMEWPKFEDGEPVRLGDAFSYGDETFYVDSVQLLRREFHLWATNGKVVTGSNGERCERPAPKMLDADGVEIRKDDTVWTTRDLDKFTVTNPNNGKFLSVSCKGEDGEDYCCYPTDLTHRAPVLAADGRPLREGEMVYSAEVSKYEGGPDDDRCFCYGLIDRMTDDYLPKCYECGAFAHNAASLAGDA